MIRNVAQIQCTKKGYLALDHFLALMLMLSQGRTEYYGEVSPVRLVFKHTSLSTNDLCSQWDEKGWKPASHPNWNEVFNLVCGPCKDQLGQLEQIDPRSSQLRSPLRLCHTDRCCIVQHCSHVWQSCSLPAARVYSLSYVLCHLIGFWHSALLQVYRDWCASARMNLSGMLAPMHDLWLRIWTSQRSLTILRLKVLTQEPFTRFRLLRKKLSAIPGVETRT